MQINRLMEIVFILLSREKVTAGELAKRFEVSERTIYRDVDTLTLCNVPVVMTKGKNGGISLLNSYKLDKALLTEEDKQEIVSSLNIFGSIAPERYGAITKLKGIFGNAENDVLEIDFDNWSNETGQKELFATLKSEAINKRKVTFKYHSMSGNSERTVCPLKLCFKGQAWYLYAFCLTKNDYRFFKINRIREIKKLHEPFTIKAKENVLNDLPQYDDTFIELTLQISGNKAYRVLDEFKDVVCLDNGDFVVKGKYPQGEWLYQYLASFLGDCVVIEPKEINDKMAEIYKKALAQSQK